jgi:hypothetical protein
VPAEHLGEADGLAGLVAKAVVARLATGRQRAPLRRDALDVAPELDLLGEQRRARTPVLGAVVRIRLARCGSELGGRLLLVHRRSSRWSWRRF